MAKDLKNVALSVQAQVVADVVSCLQLYPEMLDQVGCSKLKGYLGDNILLSWWSFLEGRILSTYESKGYIFRISAISYPWSFSTVFVGIAPLSPSQSRPISTDHCGLESQPKHVFIARVILPIMDFTSILRLDTDALVAPPSHPQRPPRLKRCRMRT